ncbi:DASH complex subunit ask1 [Gnomoniopsis sp. IMI 355080]|nr:DASH complex subunit ask1 [Gnomoniopsis sp. IMI 355080]
MSRPGSSMSRQLTLTEELERLEQSITLTLQGMALETFWKQFFEASANVSLSGYEELAVDEEDTTANGETTEHDESSADHAPGPEEDQSNVDESTSYDNEDESLLDNGDGDLAGSTPRGPGEKKACPQFAKLDTPYEQLRREMGAGAGHNPDLGDDDDSDTEIIPHQHTTRLPDMSMTPRSSLGAGDLDEDDIFSTARKNKDPLLHRLMDKNYRIQATPHKPTGVSPIKWKVTEKAQDKGKLPAWPEGSPQSSPEMAVPTLRSAAFMSPVKFPPGGRPRPVPASGGPRTPGVSVQTPATARKTKDVYAEENRGRQRDEEISWESDEDDMYGGMSPPKTIQFALPPSKLLQTPAREASKRIVDDILLTAGMEPEESSEYSPTIVKMNTDISDDTF